MYTENFGPINGHVVGIVFKEMVRRAIKCIRAHRANFEKKVKQGYGGDMDDVVTDADKAAQAIYMRSIQECFPNLGIIAEEDNVRILNASGNYATTDGVDGTKALVRRQSDGIGSMVALVWGGKVASAWVGNVMTQEIFGYRPGSDKVHRITEFDVAETLNANPVVQLHEQYLLLRTRFEQYSAQAQKIARPIKDQGRFRGYLVDNGSIGLSMAKLWKGEIGGVLMQPSYETPWDSTPIIGISKKLGYQFLRITESGLTLYNPPVTTETWRRDFEVLVVHKSKLEELVNQ